MLGVKCLNRPTYASTEAFSNIAYPTTPNEWEAYETLRRLPDTQPSQWAKVYR